MTEEDIRAKTQRIQREILERCGDGVAKKCPCPGKCPLRTNCAACVTWHRDYAMWSLPYCLRSAPGVTCEKGEHLRDPDGEVPEG